MTQQAIAAGARTRASVVRGEPRDARRFPPTGVVGEVKPHNPAGIRAGLAQLRGDSPPVARPAGPAAARASPRSSSPTARHRVTRRASTCSWPTRTSSRSAVRTGAAPTRWLAIGTIRYPGAAQPIPLWQCPTRLGVRMEPKVRSLYARWMREVQLQPSVRLTARRANRPGADIEHELAEFLTELGAELAHS